MSIRSGVTTATPTRIPFGMGVYFSGLEYSETVAPTEAEIKDAIIGATQDGGAITITPELFSPELDGVTVAMKELQIKNGETAIMETSFAELTAELVSKMVFGTVKDSTGKDYDVVTSSEYITADHFYQGFGFYGEHLDGRPMIAIFKNALCTSGLSAESKNKTNTVFKGTFACQSDIQYGTNKLPYAFFIRKEEGWTAVNASELAV